MTPSEHLLTCLIEECSEVIKAVTKAQRFGLLDSYPGYAEGRTNVEEIRRELHDVMAVIEMIHGEVWDMMPFDRTLIDQKKAKVLRFMQRSKGNGDIE